MKKLLAWLVVAGIAALIAWGILRKSAPPRIRFARTTRQTLVSTLTATGKVEPSRWEAVRAEATGLVSRVDVHNGQSVAQGATLAEISDPQLQADIEAGEAKLSEAHAALAALESGGTPAELTDIENKLNAARLALQQETRDYQALQRLAAKQAATRADVEAAHNKIRQTQMETQGLEARRKSLVSHTDVAAAKARVQDAQAFLNLARQRAAQTVLHAPIAGVVYGLEVRAGAYVHPGDLVANVGRLDVLRVRVFIDEPELGRVAAGEPVIITWDALPGKQWKGTVERKPTSIQPLGTRQVGEVICTIANPGRELIPGTNVNAEIRTATAENALIVPKEALRHDSAGDYVLLLVGDHVERRDVTTGISSITQVQIVEGLKAGDAVALPSETPLQPGARVTPVFGS